MTEALISSDLTTVPALLRRDLASMLLLVATLGSIPASSAPGQLDGFVRHIENLNLIIRYSCWDHVVKCTGVRQGKALICANCRTKQITRFAPQPGLEAADGQRANYTWKGPREEWDAAVHASLFE